MKTIQILIFFLILYSCATTKKKEPVIIIGQATNTKIGAIVTSNYDQKVYYIDSISGWNEDIIGKQIKVSGDLILKKLEPKPKINGITQQQTIGVIQVILNPIWELVSGDESN